MKHVDELRSIELEHSLSLSSEIKTARGQFFTPEVVGRRLAQTLAAALDQVPRDRVSVVDPFCGDGRLLEWFIAAWPKRDVDLLVEAWETDVDLVQSTSERLATALSLAGQKGAICVRHVDTFTEAASHLGIFDGVLTNPPWETLKPDRRHLGGLPDDRKSTYIQGIREFDSDLAARYPEAQPSRKFAGWGTNLSRVGMAVCHRLARPGGYVSIVMPSSFVADSTHGTLRSELSQQSLLLEVTSYPAEARLFEAVDVPFVTIHLRRTRNPPAGVRLVRFDATCRVIDDSIADQPAAGSSEWMFPLQAGALAGRVLARFGEMSTLEDVLQSGGYWAGRELDETGLARHVRADGIPLLKGRNIRRFGHTFDPAMLVDPSLAARFPTTERPRLVWRDVSRPSQLRRVQATLIPAGTLTGNSLGVLTAPGDDPKLLLWMLGIFSSAVFEAQLRTVLSTGHVTLASLRKMRLPRPEGVLLDRISDLAARQMEVASDDSQVELERVVCEAYGLTQAETNELFSGYPWLPQSFVPKITTPKAAA